MIKLKTLTLFLALLLIAISACESESTEPQFSISLPATETDTTFDGRLILMLSTNDDSEPRFQISDGLKTQLAYGMNVDAWATGQALDFDAKAFGYPIENLIDVPAGKYYVQALLHKYETFQRGDGHTVKMPMDRGEGQQWNRAPGNLYSTPQLIDFDPNSSSPIAVTLDQEIPPIVAPEDTDYVKHIKIRSKLLSDFWGRDMYLGAHVLLPKDGRIIQKQNIRWQSCTVISI